MDQFSQKQTSSGKLQDLDILEDLRDLLYKNKDFMGLDKRGDNMYTVGVNHYIRFVSGKGFEQLGKEISVMDKPISFPGLRLIKETDGKDPKL